MTIIKRMKKAREQNFIWAAAYVLERLEWDGGYCPWCCAPKEQGHSWNCWMSFVITAGKILGAIPVKTTALGFVNDQD